MITCRQRADERARTLEQFEALGLDVHVFDDDCKPPTPDRNRWNAERALRAAAAADDELLLVEDDIDLAGDFPAALAAARRTGQIVTFWLEKEVNHPQHYRRYLAANVPAPVGIHRVENMPNAWYGTQAILLPAWVVRKLVDAPMFGVPNGQPFDRWLRDRVTRILVALPNPVQHRNAPTLVNPGRKTRVSPTYHLRRSGSWETATWPN